jgi:hypothetical protein
MLVEIESYTEIAETLRPQNGKSHSVTWQKFIKGGFQSFDTIEEANLFSMKRREKGMFANIGGLIHVIKSDLSGWDPCEKGYLTFNPGQVNKKYNVIYPFNFKVTGSVAHQVVVVTPLVDGNAGVVQHVVLSGNVNSALTYEILKWYP